MSKAMLSALGSSGKWKAWLDIAVSVNERELPSLMRHRAQTVGALSPRWCCDEFWQEAHST